VPSNESERLREQYRDHLARISQKKENLSRSRSKDKESVTVSPRRKDTSPADALRASRD